MTGCFYIVSQQRSGTHFLMSLLSSHPSVLGAGEVLHRRSRYSYYGFLGELAQSDPDFVRPGRQYEAWKRFLAAQAGAAPAKAIGMILMYGQLLNFPPGALPKILRERPAIHLIRRNVLRVHVSDHINRMRMRDTHSSKAQAPLRVTLPVDGIVKSLKEREAGIRRANGWLEPHPRTTTVYYEDLVRDTEAEIGRIQAFLRLDPAPAHSRLTRTNPEKLSDLLDNFDEVRDQVGPTRFGWMVEE